MKLNKLFLIGCLPFFFASCSEDSIEDPQKEEGEKVYNLTYRKKYRYGKVFITMFTYNEDSEEEQADE